MKISFLKFNILYTLLTVGVYNFPFFREIYPTVSKVVFMCILLTVFCAYLFVHRLVFWPKTVKVLSLLFVFLNSIVSYFTFVFKIPITKGILANVFDTNFYEATEWLGFKFCIHFFFTCVIPFILILKLKIVFSPVRLCWKKYLSLLLVLVISVACCILPNRQSVKVYLKENFNIRYMLLPSSYLSSAIGLLKLRFETVDLINPMETMQQNVYWDTKKKNLIVFVLGESARDKSFSWDEGSFVAKPLKPYMKDIIPFRGTKSCGAATRLSLPCMFSFYNHDNYLEKKAVNTPNALDIIQKNNFKLLWLENEMGCNKVCRNVQTEFTCHSRDCVDIKLNQTFYEKLPELMQKDSLIVLHQRGSHGPRYDLRAPEEYRILKPYCQREDMSNCALKELENSYLNSMHYTSVILADLIDHLTAIEDKVNPILIYTSDHGESLGENGIYTHDSPNPPPEQTTVPFFMWIPESAREALHLDKKCLDEKPKTIRSHDNLFHSLMGLTGIKTNVYDPELDLITDCIQTK